MLEVGPTLFSMAHWPRTCLQPDFVCLCTLVLLRSGGTPVASVPAFLSRLAASLTQAPAVAL